MNSVSAARFPDQLEVRLAEQVADIGLLARKEIVEANDIVSLGDQPFAEMGAEKPGAAGAKDAFERGHGRARLQGLGTGNRGVFERLGARQDCHSTTIILAAKTAVCRLKVAFPGLVPLVSLVLVSCYGDAPFNQQFIVKVELLCSDSPCRAREARVTDSQPTH